MIFAVLSIFLVSCVEAQIASMTTTFVIAFSRHGARAPSELEYADKLSKEGVQPFTEASQLTEVGFRQHFEMGKQLIRKFHIGTDDNDELRKYFMTKTYNPEKIYV